MRKYIFIILAATALLSSGCSKMLDTKPTVDIDRNTILKDVDGLESAINGIYASMYRRLDYVTANAHQCFGNMAVTLAAELMGEDMVQIAEGPGWFWKDYTYQTRSRYTSKIWRSYFTWKYFYELINNANSIIAAAPDAEGDEAERMNILAQAYAVRAFSYFALIQSYQQTYIGNTEEPGVPVYTEPTTSSTKGKGRGTVAEVYGQIDGDLDLALGLFAQAGISQQDITYLDYYSTAMIKARVALVKNEWATAAEFAEIAMQKPGCSLLGRSEATVVKGQFNSETRAWTTGSTPFNSTSSSSVMWGAQIASDQSTVYASFFSMMDACTDVYYAAESPKCISNWLYAQIPDSDIRKGWWNGNIGIGVDDWEFGANINYCQHKFQWQDQKAHTGDYIFMRLEEAYLIDAEAQCRLGNYDAAKTALSELMSRRDTNYKTRISSLTGNEQTFASTGTVQTLLDEILLQRRIELWGEAGRIYDIQRLKKGWTRYWTVNGEETNHTEVLSKYSEYLAFPADYIECIMMIPQSEIDNNPNITSEDQNPYRQ